jgi:excinuclease Cho
MSLSECVSGLPHAPGVYIFHGDGGLPLYIGKSIDIRARVLSHLRNPDEARMMSLTRRIEVLETAGEIGALLLESHLIKTQSPLFNQRLRRLKTLCSVQLIQQPEGLRPALVDGRQVQHGITPGLYGLFSSMHAAKQKLTTVAHQHRLCLQCMGLEKATARGCFGWQIKQCAGACVGQESRAVHDDRLREALQELQVHTWPFDGAVNMVERRGDWVQKHRILNWSYQGTSCNRQLSPSLFDAGPPRFDLDTYQIVLKPLLLNWMEIEQQA